MSLLNFDFLLLGHPRSGTGFSSNTMKYLGYDVGHETIGCDGVSCWTFVTANDNYIVGRPKTSSEIKISGITRQDLTYKTLIHIVRDPFLVLKSMFNTVEENEPAFKFLEKHTNVDLTFTKIEKIIWFIIEWNRMIKLLNPNFLFRVEDDIDNLENFLTSNGYTIHKKRTAPPRNYNTRKNSNKPFSFSSNNKNLLSRLADHCLEYGYKGDTSCLD
jgi:hypothetical protein